MDIYLGSVANLVSGCVCFPTEAFILANIGHIIAFIGTIFKFLCCF